MTQVEVYADIWCPFTHVGLRRLVDRRREIGATDRLRVRAWPLELVNGEPMDAAFIGGEIADLRAQVAGDLFAGFREDRFPSTTLPALALAEAAYAVDDRTGEAMSLALRDALFEQGRDVSDPHVLDELAGSLAVPAPGEAERTAVTASLAEGRARGVVGSPHFFTGDGGYFCPTLDIERVGQHLQITSDPAAFEAFAASCFGPPDPDSAPDL